MSFHRRRKNPAGCLFRTTTFFLLILVSGYILVRYYSEVNTEIISPIAGDYHPDTSIFKFLKKEKDPDVLRDKIKQTVGDAWDNYSVYVVDFNSKFTMGMNESTIFTAASINKVPILAALYTKAAKGQIDFDKVITLQAADIQDYGTGTIRYDPAGSTYSVKTLTRLMMQKSDNTAAFLLANYILSLDVIQSYVNENGMTQTDMINNKTSNRDMATLFQKIFNKKITTPALSDEMLDFLKNSDFEDRIPLLLPKGTTVYHKIGTAPGAVHDAGVVVNGKTAYYIGIFTSDVPDEEQAAKLAADVSKTVYTFMSN
jgi:beta-lactamase class A